MPGLPGMPSAPRVSQCAIDFERRRAVDPDVRQLNTFDVRAECAEYCQCGAHYTATAAERVPTLHGRGGVEGSRAGSRPAAAAFSPDGRSAYRPASHAPAGPGCAGCAAISNAVGFGPHRWRRGPSGTRSRPRGSSRRARTTGPTSDTTSCGAGRTCWSCRAGRRACRRGWHRHRGSPCAGTCFGRPCAARSRGCRGDCRCPAPPFDRQ